MMMTISPNLHSPRQTSKGKRRTYSKLEKQQLYRDWKKSGVNKSQFCRINNLTISTFCKWVYDLEASESKLNMIPIVTNNKNLGKINTKITQPQKLPPLEINLTKNLALKFPAGCTIHQLTDILRGLGYAA